MPSGFMPTYQYRPAVAGKDPNLRTRSSRRARLFLGGTYFRAKDPGGKGNAISIALLEFDVDGTKIGKLVVTNHNTLYVENVTGPVDVDFLEQTLNWDERYVIEAHDGVAHAHRYSIRLQIAPGAVLEEDLGPVTFSELLHIPAKLSAKVTPKASEYTPASVITFKPRVRVYDLVEKSVTTTPTDGSAGVTSSGWDPIALRAAVAGDPWIEMMERSGTPAGEGGMPGIPLATKFDEQDDGVDDTFLSAFPDTYLSGGDGLPETPSGEKTGPTRSIVFINYGEKYNGSLAEVNQVYEWVGDTATAGEWKKY